MSQIVHPWERKERTLHADCRVYEIYKERFVHPHDGRSGDFFVMDSADWVMVLALTKAGEVILVKQFRFGSAELSVEVPGGIMDKADGDPCVTALRELREETGYAGENARVIGHSRPNPALLNNRAHFVLVENCEKVGEVNWDEHEEMEVLCEPLKNVFRKARRGELVHAITLNALFFLEQHLSGSEDLL